MTPRSLAAAILLPLTALAQALTPLVISDPAGDDHGDGTLSYPVDGSFSAGDFDLRSLRLLVEGVDLRVEATFRNPIRYPASAPRLARGSGPFAFNLDIYIDIDRIDGSGNTVTLPGRRATIGPEDAWEKAIVLTPRPDRMRNELIDGLRAASAAPAAEVVAVIDRSVHFVARATVQGDTVSFVVPAAFVSPAQLQDASIVAVVTAAQVSLAAETGEVLSPVATNERFLLGVAPPTAGQPPWAMGYGNGPAPATAVVDLLGPDSRQQSPQLAPGGLLLGLNRENGHGTAMAAVGGLDPAVATSLRTIQSLMVPARPRARPRDAAFFEEQEYRLRALNRLRETGLITEDEYQRKRRELLDQL